jgi:hypothetical protein
MRVAALGSILAVQVVSAGRSQSAGAAVSGRVVDAQSGGPVAGATVTIQPLTGQPITPATPAPRPIFVRADGEGRFAASGWHTPAFALRAEAAGYAPGAYAGATGSTIRLGEGETISGLTVRLRKLASIEGVVRDDQGRPLRRVAVQAFRQIPTFNGRRFAPLDPDVSTDDNGFYKISALQQGAYIVALPVIVTTMPGGVLETFRSQGSKGALTERFRSIVDDLGFVFSGLGARVGDKVVAMTSGQPAPMPWPAEPAGTRVFRSTFHPSALVAEDARLIVLDTAAVNGVDVQMRSMSAFTISGSLRRSAGPAAFVGVRLVAAGMNRLQRDHDGNAAMTVTGPDGRFSFFGVPPGSYTVKAREFEEENAAAQGLARRRPLRAWADAPVLVGSSDGVLPALTLRSPLTISGAVVLDGATVISRTPQLESLPMTLGFNSLTPVSSPSGRSRPIMAAGPFEIPVGTPGRLDLILSYGNPWFVSSMTLGGRDVTRGVLTVDRSLDDLRVTLSNRPSALSIGLRGRDGRPPTTAEVAVYPADFEQLHDVSARARRSARSTPAGAVLVAGLPAGEYLVAAFPSSLSGPAPSVSPQPTELPDLEVMRRLAPHATRVTLTDGAQGSVQVQVVDFQVR